MQVNNSYYYTCKGKTNDQSSDLHFWHLHIASYDAYYGKGSVMHVMSDPISIMALDYKCSIL